MGTYVFIMCTRDLKVPLSTGTYVFIMCTCDLKVLLSTGTYVFTMCTCDLKVPLSMAACVFIMCTHDLKVPLSTGAYVFIMCACMPYLVDCAFPLGWARTSLSHFKWPVQQAVLFCRWRENVRFILRR